jgi:type IV/VI secretion system ImpK/VasF family protein
MTLLELCEPIFLKVCELNRMARLGQSQNYAEVRNEINQLREKFAENASADSKVVPQARKLELPLVCFIDSMIASSNLQFAGQWHRERLAVVGEAYLVPKEERKKFNELGGDDKFFDLLEETLNDPSDEASERLAVFYVCLGLGFVGGYAGQPDQLRTYMNTIRPRIGQFIDVDSKSRLCPDAYKDVDTRTLIQPPNNRLVLVMVFFVFASLSLLAVYYGLYAGATADLDKSVTKILTRGRS